MRLLVLRVVLFLALLSLAGRFADGQEVASPDAKVAPGAASAAVKDSTSSPQSTSAAARQASPGAGQAPYTIRASARLVVLDVVVTDANGNVVTNLRQDDFHVEETGQPQRILNFEGVGAHPLDASVTINSTSDLDRLAPRAPVNIILLDEFSTKWTDMAFARYSIKKFLATQPDKLDTPTMLLAVDLQHFMVLRDYTQNKKEILSALDHHLGQSPWGHYSVSWVAQTSNGTAFVTLSRVAQATVGHPGHKNMIWIGRGLPPMEKEDSLLDQESLRNTRIQECANQLRDARITLYTIDPTALSGFSQPTSAYSSLSGNLNGGNYDFNRLARSTGGTAIYGRNDVDVQIGTSIRNGSSMYSLAYRPANNSLDPQKYRKIKVTVDRVGLTVTTRTGYFVEQPTQKINPINPARRMVVDMLSADNSAMVYDAVPMTVQVSASDPAQFDLHLAAQGVHWTSAADDDPLHADVMVLASTYDKKNKELARVVKSFRVNAPASAGAEADFTQGVDVKMPLAPDARAVRARFVVRDGPSGRLGTADTKLH